MKKIIYLSVIFALLSCKDTVVTGFQDKPVVESYLYADFTPTVKVSKLIAFTSDMVYSSEDVNKLAVEIMEVSTGKKYSLTSTGDGLYGNKDLIIAAGKTYQLSFPYNGTVITATTVVPQKPMNMKLSATNIAISEMGVPGSGGTSGWPSPIDITWTNNDQSYYFIYVKNVDAVKTPIDTRSPTGNDFFRNQPINADHYELNPRSFKFYGLHRVILYRIQPEYALFFQENSGSSLSISEIKANIENGLGIFTGINSESIYLYVGKP
jgi:Domain of unknown function (DUF4249)